MISNDLKIKYSSYVNYLEKYNETIKNYQYSINQYIDYLNFICREAISSGKLHDELVDFKDKFERISDVPYTLSSYLKKIINEYLTDLDNAQKVNGVSILYDWNYGGLRDYSPDYFRKLRKMAESVNYDSNWFFTAIDFVEDTFLGIAKFFGCYDNSKEDSITQTHWGLLQYNDVTKNQIDIIESKVREADIKCHNNLMKLKDLIDRLDEYIMLFYKTISNYQDSPKSIDLSEFDFDSKYLEMVNCYKDIGTIDKVTDEEIEEFISDLDNQRIIIQNTEVITDYLSEILDNMDFNDADFWLLFGTQFINIGEETIAAREEYKKILMKNELIKLMDDLAGSYSYDGSNEQKIVDEAKTFFSELKKSGKSLYDFLNTHRNENGKLILDGRTKIAKRWKSFLGCLGNIGDILKYGNQGIELISKLFIEYDKNIEFLDSFERNTELSDEMKECFKEIRDMYEHKLAEYLDGVITIAINGGMDVIYAIPVFNGVGIIKGAIGVIGEITGESEKAAARTELLSYGYEIVSSSRSAFLNSINKLKETDKNSEEYSQALNDFKNCFQIYKKSLERLFEKMAVSTEGVQRDYFYYCASKYATMTIENFNSLDVMSYDEYVKQ